MTPASSVSYTLLQAIHPPSRSTTISSEMYAQQAIGMPSTPTRKRRRLTQVSYSEVKELDSEGNLREVIVIEDTPPPSVSATASASVVGGMGTGSIDNFMPPRRTRAQVAAAAKAAMSAAVANGVDSSSGSVITHSINKKRKRENGDATPVLNGIYAKKPNLGIPSTRQWLPPDNGAVLPVRLNLSPFPFTRLFFQMLIFRSYYFTAQSYSDHPNSSILG